MSWRKVRLGDVLTESKIICENPNADRRIKVRLKVLGVEKRGLENEIEGATKQFIRKAGQFIYGKQNFHKGAFGIIPKELDGFESSSDLPAFDVSKECLPEWIFYFFKQGNYYLELSKIARGVATQRIHPDQIFDLKIPLPDIKTQTQFLLNIKSIENRGCELSTELNYQQDLLTQVRQSFLKEAMQGKLVKQDQTDGNATDLLKKIKTDKLKSGKKEKELPPIKEEEIPFTIPKNWAWCRLGEIAANIEYGTSQKAEMSSEHIPVLRMNNIQDGKIDYEKLKYVQSSIDDLPKLYLKEGDLLFNRTNSYELVGKSGVYHGDDDVMTFASYLIRVQFSKNISTDFVNHYINSSFCRKTQLEPEIIQQNGQANFNGTKLKNIICPLPPLAEQNRIVKKLKEIINLCEELKATIRDNQNHADQFLQVALKDALQPKAIQALI